MNTPANLEVERLREEVAKLSQVVTEVMGEEFDSIVTRQNQDQRSTVRWLVSSLSVSIAMMRLLIEQGVLDEGDCRERVGDLRRRLLEHAEALGSDPDIESFMDKI